MSGHGISAITGRNAIKGINGRRWTGPDALRHDVEAAAAWDAGDSTRRLWARDSLWTNSDEARWLGWLDGVEARRRLLHGNQRTS